MSLLPLHALFVEYILALGDDGHAVLFFFPPADKSKQEITQVYGLLLSFCIKGLYCNEKHRFRLPSSGSFMPFIKRTAKPNIPPNDKGYKW